MRYSFMQYCRGKWTTWREMSEELVDKIVGENGPKSRTLDLKLFGGEGCK